MLDIGTVCMKLAGRDAGMKAVIVEKIDGTLVLIDGQVRRRKCNIMHLEPLDQTLDIKKGAKHADVVAAFKKIHVVIADVKSKSPRARPIKVRKSLLKKKDVPKIEAVKKDVPKKETKLAKKVVKKVVKKVTKKVAKK